MSERDAPADPAVAELRRLIPEGSNEAILAAMSALAERGDEAALQAVEAHLAGAPLAIDYGDRDSDPAPWELSPRVFVLLASWWERLGLADERAAWLAADWLGEQPGAERHFGRNSHTFFTHSAPHVAPLLAPLLIAACRGGSAERRARAASGLRYAPTDEAIDALVALLADPVERVANQARSALSLLAHPPSPGSSRPVPSAPEAVALRLIQALASPSPAVRRRAVASFAWFAGIQHRNSISLPPQFARVLPALAKLLTDPDPEVQRLAAERIGAAGRNLDQLRPSRAAALGLRLPALDLIPLLNHPDEEIGLAALYLAGRAQASGGPQGQTELAAQIVGMLDALRGHSLGYRAALYALGRLQAVAAIPAIAAHLEQPDDPYSTDALLVLAQLRHLPAIPHLVRLLHDLTYGQDAREALDQFAPGDVLPPLLAQIRASARTEREPFRPGPWEVSYLEAHGDAEALALLHRSESYQFAARYIGAERDGVVAAARRLERRLLLAAGVPADELDDPGAAVRRILTGPVHPLECERGNDNTPAALGEQRARWRNLCVAIEGWLLADPPPPLEPALDEAERLLAGFPDEVREAHERWWLDVTRGGQLGLPRLSAVARARINPKAPWRLARALVINEGIGGALDPAECLAWEGLSRITALSIDHAGWLKALAAAPASCAPRVLRAGIYDDAVAGALAKWPGLALVERLEIRWSRNLSDTARTTLLARTLAARREQAWRTPQGTFLIPRDFTPVHDSSGRWIVRPDGEALAVATSYDEVTPAGELLRSYAGPARYSSPEEWTIGQIYDVVDGALHRYSWREGERPTPGTLDDTVLLDGLVPVARSSLPPLSSKPNPPESPTASRS